MGPLFFFSGPLFNCPAHAICAGGGWKGCPSSPGLKKFNDQPISYAAGLSRQMTTSNLKGSCLEKKAYSYYPDWDFNISSLGVFGKDQLYHPELKEKRYVAIYNSNR